MITSCLTMQGFGNKSVQRQNEHKATDKRKNSYFVLAIISAALVLFLGASVSYALDLSNIVGVGGPLATALQQLQDLTPGIKAIVAMTAFLACFVTLASLRNFGVVIMYAGVMIFGAVGLTVGGAIMGATL